jgi:hypothetical protein
MPKDTRASKRLLRFAACSILSCTLFCHRAASETLSPDVARKEIAARAQKVIEILARRDPTQLSRFVSEEKGVRFSPYAWVDTDADVVLKPADLRNPRKLQNVRKWGSYDGSGLPIRMSFIAYYRKFIYDRDFAHAPKVGHNEVIAKSNTTNNTGEVYSDSIVVEYYWPPPEDPEKANRWSALRLIFQKTGTEWFLVGVAHDQWAS